MHDQAASPGSSPGDGDPTSPALSDARASVHERLLSLGAEPIGRASDFAAEVHALMDRTPLFADLDEAQTRRLGESMQVYEVPAGACLIDQGEIGNFMMLLLVGTVDVLRRSRHDHASRIAVAGPGHALGEMSMFDGEPRFASCVTIEPCRIAVLTRHALLQVLYDEPRLGIRILLKLVQLLSERLRQTSGKLVSLLETATDT